VRLLGPLYRDGHASNAKTFTRHTVGKIDADPKHPELLNFRNGMVAWESGDLLEHSPDYLSTTQLGTIWDPAATCPNFDTFLASVLSPDYIDLAWQMIGYLLYSGNPMQVAFMLTGPGGNGKGTLLRVVQDLLGKGNVASESLDSLNENRFAAVSLYGKIANIAGDIDGTYQESTANFKKLTGEDFYYAERKYGGRFGFTSWAVPIFSANKIPGSADVTEGYLRRWIILSMPRIIPDDEKILGLSSMLAEELPGIAAKAVPALRELMKRKRFRITGDAEKGKQDFAEAIDQVRQWISDATIPSIDHFEPRTILYQAYKSWAERNNAGGKLSASAFYHRLETIGLVEKKVQGIRGFYGIIPSPETRPLSAATDVGAFFDGEEQS
jgi:P4 family phage/plasmid primase-like protien